jgi:hypothetical protein
MKITNKSLRQVWRWRGPENRRHTRWHCNESTCFSADRQLYEGTFRDMSTGGTFIEARGRFKVGQPVIVAGILARDGSEEKRTGRIVRIETAGIAVAFTDRQVAAGAF